MLHNKRPNSVDGFTVRRNRQTPGSQPGGIAGVRRSRQGGANLPPVVERARTRDGMVSNGATSTASGVGNLQNDIDSSLRSIDESGAPEPQLRQKRRWLKLRRPKRPVRLAFIIAGIFLLLVGGYLALKFIIASGRVADGNIFDLLGNGEVLKTDENGRSNIILFGTSEDSPAHQEQGSGELTDSIIIVSLDQEKKDAILFSVPRDLWVSYNEACVSGYEGKINVVFECGRDGGTDADGAEKLMSIAGENFGLDIQYYAQVNYTALQDAVAAVGGITVEIDSDDPRGIYDPNFDWQCNFECNLVRWPNGPAKLNGEQALALARARNAAGGYGLGGGNFDREANQQKIILALREKAISAGTLSNPVKVGGLIDALGNNVRTNFSTGEIKTLTTLANDIPDSSISRLNLVDEEDPLMTTSNVGGQSIVQPVAGLYDFSEIQQFLRSKFNADPGLESEAATITVLNASGIEGAATRKADELAAVGFSDVLADNAPATIPVPTTVSWYTLSPDKTKSAQKLQSTLGVAAGDVVPDSLAGLETDFVIIIGDETS